MKPILTLFFPIFLVGCAETPDPESTPITGTFSIVAVDQATGEIGVAVQSKIVAVGSIVPFAEAGVGAIATQSLANVTYGPVGLRILRSGATPEQTIAMLTESDVAHERRQVGVVSASGLSVAFTGAQCLEWAGGRIGDGYAVQGNILADHTVIDAMADSFEASVGEILPERLLGALEAGQAAGGDRRGRQSAALLVVREGWGYGGQNDRFRDLRVDEHEQPIAELRRVYEKHRALFPRPQPVVAP